MVSGKFEFWAWCRQLIDLRNEVREYMKTTCWLTRSKSYPENRRCLSYLLFEFWSLDFYGCQSNNYPKKTNEIQNECCFLKILKEKRNAKGMLNHLVCNKQPLGSSNSDHLPFINGTSLVKKGSELKISSICSTFDLFKVHQRFIFCWLEQIEKYFKNASNPYQNLFW